MTDEPEDSFVSISDEEYAALQAKVHKESRLDFHGRYTRASNWRLKFLVIQAAYEYYLPSIMKAARTGHYIDPNIVTWEFTPIEDAAWCQIRALGLPFYPQFPVLDFFADFADPFRKIVIELDGKKFHDEKRDAARDKRMREAGWKIHRIAGRTAKRYLEDVFPVDVASEIEDAINSEYPFSPENKSYLDMAESTLDGCLLAIRRRYYTKD